jgi:hypothetical protein
MLSYKEEDSDIAMTVLNSIERHLWYLTEELVVLALFNNELSPFTRQLLALKLFSTERPSTFTIGKPKFPKLDNLRTLQSFIGPRSWLIFSL